MMNTPLPDLRGEHRKLRFMRRCYRAKIGGANKPNRQSEYRRRRHEIHHRTNLRGVEKLAIIGAIWANEAQHERGVEAIQER